MRTGCMRTGCLRTGCLRTGQGAFTLPTHTSLGRERALAELSFDVARKVAREQAVEVVAAAARQDEASERMRALAGSAARSQVNAQAAADDLDGEFEPC